VAVLIAALKLDADWVILCQADARNRTDKVSGEVPT
jgi:hypothetical protein